MTTDKVDNAQRTAAKVAGVAGLLGFVLVVFGNYVLLEPLVIARNAADTARNILAHQTQFRVALTCFIAYGIGAIVLLTALYVILAPVNRGLALAGALFRLVFAMLWLIAPLNSLAALRLLGDASYLKVFEPDRLQALARVQLACRHSRVCNSPEVSTIIMWACHFSAWPRPCAPGCGLSRNTSHADCRSSVWSVRLGASFAPLSTSSFPTSTRSLTTTSLIHRWLCSSWS